MEWMKRRSFTMLAMKIKLLRHPRVLMVVHRSKSRLQHLERKNHLQSLNSQVKRGWIQVGVLPIFQERKVQHQILSNLLTRNLNFLLMKDPLICTKDYNLRLFKLLQQSWFNNRRKQISWMKRVYQSALSINPWGSNHKLLSPRILA